MDSFNYTKRKRITACNTFPGTKGTSDIFLFWFTKTMTYGQVYFSSHVWPISMTPTDKLNLKKVSF